MARRDRRHCPGGSGRSRRSAPDDHPFQRQHASQPALALRGRADPPPVCLWGNRAWRSTWLRTSAASRSRAWRPTTSRRRWWAAISTKQRASASTRRHLRPDSASRCRSASGWTPRSRRTPTPVTFAPSRVSYTFFRTLADAERPALWPVPARMSGEPPANRRELNFPACRPAAVTRTRGRNGGDCGNTSSAPGSRMRQQHFQTRRREAAPAPAGAAGYGAATAPASRWSPRPPAPHKHPYHLVDPSPWPLVAAFSAGDGAAASCSSPTTTSIGCSASASWACSAPWPVWWRDVVHEIRTPGLHTPIVRIGLRYGMSLFIASEVMFFVAFFWAYFHFALYPEHVAGAETAIWPPQGIHTFDPFSLPFLNTMILLLSGCTVTWAHHALIEGDRKGMLQGLGPDGGARASSSPSSRRYEYAEAPFAFTAAASTPPPSSWPPASTASTSSSARSSWPSAWCAAAGPLHAAAPLRLRGGRLVLALRGRGVAVPVRVHLLSGARERSPRTDGNRGPHLRGGPSSSPRLAAISALLKCGTLPFLVRDRA